jgi:hypothetical protein
MMKFSSLDQSESFDSRGHDVAPPPADAPRAGDVIFEIGVILAAHLAFALVVTLRLRDCTSC